MSVTRVRAVLTAVLATLVLALTSCTPSSDDEPSADPTPEISVPSSSTSTTPEPKPETAKQFIRRWRKASDAMQNNGKIEPYLRLSRGCEACKDFADTVDEVYSADGSITFAGTDVLQIRRVGGSQSRPTFDVKMRVGNTKYVASKGAQPKTLSGGKKTYLVSLKHVDDEWFVTDLLRRSR